MGQRLIVLTRGGCVILANSLPERFHIVSSGAIGKDNTSSWGIRLTFTMTFNGNLSSEIVLCPPFFENMDASLLIIH